MIDNTYYRNDSIKGVVRTKVYGVTMSKDDDGEQ